MKKIALTAILGLTVSVSMIVTGAGDVFQQLKVSKNDASREVIQSLVNSNVDVYRVRGAFRNASPEVRTAMVEQTLIWTKAYVSSPQFAKDYAAYRTEMKPQPPERTTTVDQELAARRKQRQDDLAEAKKSLAEIPKEYRAAAEEGYKAAVAGLKQMDTPEMRKLERDGIVQDRANEDQDYQERVAQWEEEYPADPKVLVKQRLQDFLRETANVDYAAKLNGRRFANASYESKPSEWKLAYRAGKMPTEKARAFAAAWLKEL
ncbi:MAG TPA: hypothetical protein VEO54_18495 [Thermoanaerobaculia bacterium]|nr:hypothetical protein [Thermoanaerobaculia bacterium]